jgi:hypothetical protein
MQRAMAKEAESERERRAKIVAAEGEYQAAVKLGQAADIITQQPVALQLRTLQTMAEISVERNSTIIFPAQFMTTVQEAFARLSKDSGQSSREGLWCKLSESMQRNAREHYAVHAARTAFQISDALLSWMRSFPSLN